MIVQAEQLLERLGTTQGQQLETRLVTRTSSIYTGVFWSTVITDAARLSEGLANDARDLLHGQRRARGQVGWVLVLVLFVALTAVPCARWLTSNFGRRPQTNESSYSQRTLNAFVKGIATGLLPAAIISGIGLALVNQELVGEQSITLVNAITVSLVLAIVTVAPGLERLWCPMLPRGAY